MDGLIGSGSATIPRYVSALKQNTLGTGPQVSAGVEGHSGETSLHGNVEIDYLLTAHNFLPIRELKNYN